MAENLSAAGLGLGRNTQCAKLDFWELALAIGPVATGFKGPKGLMGPGFKGLPAAASGCPRAAPATPPPATPPQLYARPAPSPC